MNARNDMLMVGTFGHEIISLPINLQSNSCNISQAKIVINGHFAPRSDWTNELWGLSIFPNQEKYVTCSDDGKLKIWDTRKKVLIKSLPLNLDKTGKEVPLDMYWKELKKEHQGRAVDISPKGDFIAVGMNEGTLRVFQTSNWSVVYTGKQGKEWIEDLKFSPDGKYLAVSGHDNKIQMFTVPDFKKPSKAFGKSSSFITHLDWSLDSQHIRTNDGSYELMYYTVSGQ